MTAKADENQEAMFSSHTVNCSWNKCILKSPQSILISCPSIITDFNPPIPLLTPHLDAMPQYKPPLSI